MSWEVSPSSGHHQEGAGSVGSLSPSRGHLHDHQEEQILECSPRQGGCEQVPLPNVSPAGVNSRRNKRKQSEPRRLSTSSLVVKEEPSDHPDDRGRLTTPGLTIDTEDDYRYIRGGSATGTARVRQRYGHHRNRHRPDDVDELIPSSMVSLHGHTSRASNSSEDSLDSNPVPASAAIPLHSMINMYRGGSGGMTSDGDIDDQDATGSQGTCADSPELMMAEEGDMDGDIHGHTEACTSPDSGGSSRSGPSASRSKKTSRSYKNLSRSRRIVANARERNRVHTISAAFEGLRRAVPSYSHNQKLSKLAILRIACSYILALASLADMDYSPDQQQMSFSECVDMCTRTLQSEGRSKRRKVPME